MASSLTTIRQQALYDLQAGMVLPNATLSGLAAGTFTSTKLAVAQWTTSHLSGMGTGVFRPANATGAADNWRPVGAVTVATGATAVAPNWSDTTLGTEAFELWYWLAARGIRPDVDIIEALNRAMEDTYFTTLIALSHISNLDGDMTSSVTTAWTGAAGTTLNKVTTALYVPWSMRALNVLNDSANDYADSGLVSWTQGSRVRTFAMGNAVVGTASLYLKDETNNANITTDNAPSHSEIELQLMARNWEDVPATSKQGRVRLLNTSATGDSNWNQAWLYKEDVLRINLPSYVSEHFQAPVIYQWRPMGTQTATNVWNAQAGDLVPLVEGKDYDLIFDHADANPNAVKFRSNAAYEWPLFVQAQRPYSDKTTFATTESAETDAPLKQLMPRFERELLDTVYANGVMPDAHWKEMSAKIGNFPTGKMQRSQASRPVKPAGPAREYFGGVRRL